MSYKLQRKIILAGFLAIPMLLFAMFLVYPAFNLVTMSFTNWDGLLRTYDFIGFDNYTEVFTSENVWISLRNNGIYAINGIVQNILALLFALILVSKIKGRNFFRVIIFTPFIINSAAVSYMFSYLYDFDKSPINVVLNSLGLEPLKFISDVNLVNFSLAAISLWRYIGFTMVIYIAALESIPHEMYESSMLDGANSWQTLRYITIPNIIRIIELNLFLCISGALNAFVEPLLITNGGPGYASSTFLVYIINTAFQFNNFSLAAAMSVVLIIIVLVVTGIQNKVVLRSR